MSNTAITGGAELLGDAPRQRWPATEGDNVMQLSRGFGAWAVMMIALGVVLASASYAASPTEGGGLLASPLSSPLATPLLHEEPPAVNAETALTDEGIAPARALEDLALQGQIQQARLPLRIETALGDAYAGVWLDSAAAKLDVGVTSAASRRAVRQVSARTGLAGEVVEVPVRSTWRALLDAQERWTRKLGSLLASGDATTGIDASGNDVVVTLDSAIPSREREALSREATAANVDLVIDPTTTRRAQPATVTCESPFTTKKARCEPTLVSGVGVSIEGRGNCTSGPSLLNGNETYMLLAGHCFTISSVKSMGDDATLSTLKVSSEYPSVASAKEVGKDSTYYFNEHGDMGETRISAPSSFKQAGNTPVPALMAEWSVKPASPSAIAGQAYPVDGASVCHEGRTTGEQCGSILAVNINGTTPHQVSTNACAEPGDSGGIWDLGTATDKSPALVEGLLTASFPGGCPKNATSESFFQPLSSPLGYPQGGIQQTFGHGLLARRNETRRQVPANRVHLQALPASRDITVADVYYEVSSPSVSVACVNGLGEGEATSTEAIGKLAMVFNDCMGQTGGEKSEECTVKSAGAKSEGEVATKTLKGTLGEVASAEAYSQAGLLLEPETGKTIVELTGKCLGSSTGLTGSLAAELTPAEQSTEVLEATFDDTSSKPLIKAITLKTGSAKPKLELGSSEAAEQAYLELEFAEAVELL